MTILLPIYPINRASPWLGAMARHERPKKAGLTKVYNNDDNDANKGNSVEVEIVNLNATRQRDKQTFRRFLLFPFFFFLGRYLSKFPRRQDNVFDSAENLHTFLAQHLLRWLFFACQSTENFLGLQSLASITPWTKKGSEHNPEINIDQPKHRPRFFDMTLALQIDIEPNLAWARHKKSLERRWIWFSIQHNDIESWSTWNPSPGNTQCRCPFQRPYEPRRLQTPQTFFLHRDRNPDDLN